MGETITRWRQGGSWLRVRCKERVTLEERRSCAWGEDAIR